MAEKVLVTGGAGFIGSHLVLELLRQGNEVIVVDNLTTGKQSNLDLFKREVEFSEKDINDTLAVTKLCKGVRYLYHLAAIPAVPKSFEDPLRTNHANIDGTLSVLVAARDVGVQRVIFSSSAAVYGNSNKVPKTEDMPAEPVSPYATHKFTGEQYMQQFNKFFNLETLSLRYFNVFGPRQDANSSYATVIPLFISLMKSGIAPTIHGDGSMTRDYVYVRDVVEANILATQSKVANGEIYNIASGIPISVNMLFETTNRVLGTNFVPQYGPYRFGDIQHSSADISKACSILGYQPKTSLEGGIKMIIESVPTPKL